MNYDLHLLPHQYDLYDSAQRLQVEGNVDAEVKIRVIKDEPKNEQQLG